MALELVQIDVRGGPGRSKGVPGSPESPGPRKRPIFSQIQNPPLLNTREMALELVSGADFMCKLMCGAGPVDLRGSRRSRGRPDPQKSTISGRLKNHIFETQVLIVRLMVQATPSPGVLAPSCARSSSAPRPPGGPLKGPPGSFKSPRRRLSLALGSWAVP